MTEPAGLPVKGAVGNSPVSIGRFTYGTEHLEIRQWGEGAALTVGSFCSISSAVTIFLGGNHRPDWITTFPFGHIFQGQLGGTEIKGQTQTQVRAKSKLDGKNFADDAPRIVTVHEGVIAADAAFDFLADDFNVVSLPGRMKTPVGFTEPFTVHLRDA